MNKSAFKSIGAVLTGLLTVAILGFVTDTVLQRIGILPIPQEEKFGTAWALLALSYHILYAFFGCSLAAWLAPNRPMAHAVAVGGFGVVISTLGFIAIVAGDLAPAWYGWALIILSLPVAWMGGKLSIWHFNQRKERSLYETIMTNRTHRRSGRVTTEGDELYFEVRGQGKPLLMISGGGGDGGAYSLVAEILSNEYKVITYDRRACARSTMHAPHHFDISQQSRDAVAVLHAAGERAAVVFGNSSGAAIALEMATTQPQAVRAVVAHEPPLARIHPDPEKWQRFFTNVYDTAVRFGDTLAMLKFAFGIGIDFSFLGAFKAVRAARKEKIKHHEQYLDQKKVMDFFIKQEMVPVTNYEPDVETIKKNQVQVFMAAGKRSLDKKRFYAQTAKLLADKLGCEFVLFPGHHGSFVDMPNEWATTLSGVLHKIERITL
jgi:pimeloyl-ACP methyl ester carboxylesterase